MASGHVLCEILATTIPLPPHSSMDMLHTSLRAPWVLVLIGLHVTERNLHVCLPCQLAASHHPPHNYRKCEHTVPWAPRPRFAMNVALDQRIDQANTATWKTTPSTTFPHPPHHIRSAAHRSLRTPRMRSVPDVERHTTDYTKWFLCYAKEFHSR